MKNIAGTTSRRLRIGYLPFYVRFYEDICENFRDEKDRFASECAEQLAPFGDVIWDGSLIEEPNQAIEVGKKLSTEGVDCIVVVTTIAVFAGIPLAALRQCKAPVILWNPELTSALPRQYDMVQVVRHTTQIGVQAVANALLREGRRYFVVTGFRYGKHTYESLRRIFRILHAACSLKTARLLDIGGAFPLMSDIEIDEEYLVRHLGASITRVENIDLDKICNAVSETDIANHRESAETHNCVTDMSSFLLDRSLRLSIAIDHLAKENHADAGSINCHQSCRTSSAIGITACYALGIQNDRGRPFTCTGDLPTSLAMLLLKRLTDCAMYTELQVMDEERGAIVISNSGEGEGRIRRVGAPSTVRPCENFSGLCGRGASFAYPIQAGPATIASFTPTPNSEKPFRLIVAEGEIGPEVFPEIGAIAGLFRFSHTNLHAGYTRWLSAGPIHHAATTIGHHADDLEQVCDLINAEFVGI